MTNSFLLEQIYTWSILLIKNNVMFHNLLLMSSSVLSSLKHEVQPSVLNLIKFYQTGNLLNGSTQLILALFRFGVILA